MIKLYLKWNITKAVRFNGQPHDEEIFWVVNFTTSMKCLNLDKKYQSSDIFNISLLKLHWCNEISENHKPHICIWLILVCFATKLQTINRRFFLAGNYSLDEAMAPMKKSIKRWSDQEAIETVNLQIMRN